MNPEELRCTVTELMHIFHDGLVAITPIAERLALDWREGQHRHWENLAEAMYDSCVRGPIETDVAARNHELRLARYDIDAPSYVNSSWIAVRSKSFTTRQAALVRLMTDIDPFDMVEVAILDPVTLRPISRRLFSFAESDFSYIRRSKEGEDVEVRHIVSDD